ncbi:MAG: hypothetical protein ABIB12_01245 [Patescibacteria group bacterium]
MKTKDIVLRILKEEPRVKVSAVDLDAPLVALFESEFSPSWGEVLAEIEQRVGIILTADDTPLCMTLGELIAKVDQKRRVLV